MDQIRLRKQADGLAKFARPQVSTSTESAVTLHPYTYAMEQLKQGDTFSFNHDWASAKTRYAQAVKTLERMSLSDQRTLRHCLQRLAQSQLRLFDLQGALFSFIRSKQITERNSNDILSAETEDLMNRIRAARKPGLGRDDDYTPRFFTGHL